MEELPDLADRRRLWRPDWFVEGGVLIHPNHRVFLRSRFVFKA